MSTDRIADPRATKQPAVYRDPERLCAAPAAAARNTKIRARRAHQGRDEQGCPVEQATCQSEVSTRTTLKGAPIHECRSRPSFGAAPQTRPRSRRRGRILEVGGLIQSGRRTRGGRTTQGAECRIALASGRSRVAIAFRGLRIVGCALAVGGDERRRCGQRSRNDQRNQHDHTQRCHGLSPSVMMKGLRPIAGFGTDRRSARAEAQSVARSGHEQQDSAAARRAGRGGRAGSVRVAQPSQLSQGGGRGAEPMVRTAVIQCRLQWSTRDVRAWMARSRIRASAVPCARGRAAEQGDAARSGSRKRGDTRRLLHCFLTRARAPGIGAGGTVSTTDAIATGWRWRARHHRFWDLRSKRGVTCLSCRAPPVFCRWQDHTARVTSPPARRGHERENDANDSRPRLFAASLIVAERRRRGTKAAASPKQKPPAPRGGAALTAEMGDHIGRGCHRASELGRDVAC